MNKKLTRLTALLLVVLMLMSTFSTALADTGLTKDQYTQALQQMQKDLSLIPTQLETPNVYTTTVNTTTLVPTYAAGEGEVSPAKSITVTAQTAQEDVGGYQWQIYVGGVWANIQGETAQTLELTYAMAKQAMDADNNVQLRCRLIPAVATFALTEEEAIYEKEIYAKVNDSITYTEQTLSTDVTVTQYTQNEEPDDAYNAAWELQNAAKTPAVSTYALTRAGEGSDNFNIVINYVFENNEVAAESYGASLAAGSSFKATVTHPPITGYVPSQGTASGWDVEGISYTGTETVIDITNIQNDITLVVTYKPADVKYTVLHYQEKVGMQRETNIDLKYELVLTEPKTGKTGSIVSGVEKEYDGFYDLLYEPQAIAADGTTVVKVYYDRYYYIMKFDLGGGYGVEPIYAQYGAEIGDVGTPTKPGYTFAGWLDKDGNAATIPSNMPAETRTYTAKWTMNDTAQVKVVFWGENPNDEEYSYLSTGTINVAPGKEYTYVNGDLVIIACGKEEHTHTAECYKCGKEEHTQHTDDCLGNCTHQHTLDCYSVDGNTELEALSSKPDGITVQNPVNGAVYTYVKEGYMPWESDTTYYYLYLNGMWYHSENTANYGDNSGQKEITPSCNHSHTDACYSCEVHTHTSECYTCGKDEHTHGAACGDSSGSVSSGLDSTLWTFVRSDTATVDPDGSTVINVYYDRTEFTLHFRDANSSVDDFGTIVDKWGADIEAEFFAVSDKAGYQSWSENRDASSPWTNLIAIMPPKDMIYYSYEGSGTNVWTMTYYKETFTEGDYAEAFKVLLHRSGGTTVSKEEFLVLEGFTFNAGLSTKTGSSTNGAKFYYDRNYYTIEYYNPNELIKKQEKVYFQEELGKYDFTPGDEWIPDYYEPGSVVFDGWYLNPECTGEEFNFATHTMPAIPNDTGDSSDNNSGETALTVYAKWVPATHDVYFYLDEAAWREGTVLSTHPKKTVPHNAILNEKGGDTSDDVANPSNGSYTFVGWFYMDNGVEKAFDFANMPIKKDLHVYGKWSSNVLKEYFVYFKIQGTDTEIADPITGSALAGTGKTFDAKGGEELYEGYREGYFPLVKSHSMILDIEKDENNRFTFWYVQRDAVPYSVYYVTESQNEAGTLESIELDGKTYYIVADTYMNSTNRKAVVTEKFVPVSGYMPDAFQKRLVVDASENADNKIIFIYSVDTTHAYYKITHYTQNPDGKTWTEYASSEAVGDIGKTYSADPLTIRGFTHDPNVEGTVMSGVLTANGLELKLYYVRSPYPYEVHYLEEGTNKVLHNPTNGVGQYGMTVTGNAVDIENYEVVGDESQSITIDIVNEGAANPNIITFYYKEKEVTINYKVVGPDGKIDTNGTSGKVDLNDGVENPLAATSETVEILSGTAKGATAAASSNAYRFVGWYSDAACTTQVGTNAYYQPTKEGTAWVNGTTYYAKFEDNTVTLIINKTVLKQDFAEVIAPSRFETFQFEVLVKDSDGKYVNATPADSTNNPFVVMVQADGNKTGSYEIELLYVKGGEYKVVEQLNTNQSYTTTMTTTPNDENPTKTTELDISILAGDSATVYVVNTASDTYDAVVTKKWEDNNNTLGYRPESISLTLKSNANGEVQSYEVADSTREVVDDNTWTYTHTVPKYDAQGNIIQYSVTEAPVANYTTSIVRDTVDGKPSPNKLTVTNSIDVGDLTITKNVPNAANVPAGVATMFDFNVVLTDANNAALTNSFNYIVTTGSGDTLTQVGEGSITSGGKITLSNGQTATIQKLPQDTKYTVTETVPVGYVASIESVDATSSAVTATTATANGTIDMGKVDVLNYTNTYTTGNLTVTKTVVGEHAPEDDAFTFNVTITPAISGTFDGVIFTNGVATLTLKGGQSKNITGLPVDAAYTVVETADDDYVTTWTGDRGKIVANATQTAAFTNTYKTGNLAITKSGLEDDDKAIFTVTVTKGSSYNKTFRIVMSNETVTLADLPYGASYTVAEEAGWAWRYGTTTITDNGDGTIGHGTTDTVNVVNEKTTDKWLTDESSENNVFADAPTATN